MCTFDRAGANRDLLCGAVWQAWPQVRKPRAQGIAISYSRLQQPNILARNHVGFPTAKSEASIIRTGLSKWTAHDASILIGV